MEFPLVSIITPTHNRECFLARCYRCVREQDWPAVEWLILDSSAEPSSLFTSVLGDNILYFHEPKSRTLGEKRNELIRRSRGQFIAHFDDDDLYCKQYISFMVRTALAKELDFVKLSSFYVFHTKSSALAFCNLEITTGLHFAWSRDRLCLHYLTEEDTYYLDNIHLGYGFSYLYRRTLWESFPFPPVNWNEDGIFAENVLPSSRNAVLSGDSGLVLHVLHDQNASRCFPQYILPPFLVPITLLALLQESGIEFNLLSHRDGLAGQTLGK